MTTLTMNHEPVDRVLPGWVLVWSVALTIAVASVVQGFDGSNAPDEANVFLGAAMGGLFAAWSMMGTWIFQIDLPPSVHAGDSRDAAPQRILPRMEMLLFWLVNVLVLAFVVRHDSGMMAQVLLMAAAGIMGPVITWQWTHRRIHRSMDRRRRKRSIRQILRLTFAIALSSAMLNFGDRWGGLSSAFTVMVVSCAFMWALMLWIVLGRWWGLILVTVPIIVAQGIAVSYLIDPDSRNFDDQLMRCAGYHLGFYLYALLLQTLMRTGGHHW